jgi:hypothetical protein
LGRLHFARRRAEEQAPLSRRLHEQLALWSEIVARDIPALNARIKRAEAIEIRGEVAKIGELVEATYLTSWEAKDASTLRRRLSRRGLCKLGPVLERQLGELDEQRHALFQGKRLEPASPVADLEPHRLT